METRRASPLPDCLGSKEAHRAPNRRTRLRAAGDVRALGVAPSQIGTSGRATSICTRIRGTASGARDPSRRSGAWSIRIGHSPPRCDRARDRTLGAGREQRSRAARPSHRVQRGRSAGYPKSTWRRRKLRPSRPTLHSAAPSGRRRSGNRPSIAPSAISVSRRATAAPRQWWMP